MTKRACLEAALITIGSWNDWRETAQTDVFVGKYKSKAEDSSSQARTVLAAARNLLPRYPLPIVRARARQITALMDLAEYRPTDPRPPDA